MTAPALTTSTPAENSTPRPGSRAARLANPRAVDALRELAVEHGVCIRPIALRRTDLTTGLTELIDLPCGATLESKCPPCAKRARRLRQVQIREGWHRSDEPTPGPQPATPRQRELIVARAHLEFDRAALHLIPMDPHTRVAELARLNHAIDAVEQEITAEGLRGSLTPGHNSASDDQADDDPPRRVRSTRRRPEVPELPRQKVDPRTVGRTYIGTDGSVHRPSMWLTLTLDSYGPVHSIHPGRPCACRRWHTQDAPELGTPVDPASYDYRRAAWDAVHFPRLLDRYFQNLRRAVGWNVQYAGCVEPQRRLAPHAHFAIRGTISRAMLEKVAAATYHQVWWPPADRLRYPLDRPPVWDGQAWVDPNTRVPLPTWSQALDTIDAEPDARAGAPRPVRSTGQGQGRRARLSGCREDDRLHHEVRHQGRRRLPHRQLRPAARSPRPALAPAPDHAVFRPLRHLAALRRPTQERSRPAPPRQLQRPGTPEDHLGHRWAPRPGLPRLVRQDPRRPPRRRPRLGQSPARHQHRGRRGPGRHPAADGRVGDGPARRPRPPADGTPATTRDQPTHPAARPAQRRSATSQR